MKRPLRPTLLRSAAFSALIFAAACGNNNELSQEEIAEIAPATPRSEEPLNTESTKPKPAAPAHSAAQYERGEAIPNSFWWPEQVDLSPLRQNAAPQNPLDPDFDYAEAFSRLDIDAVKADLEALMTDSQDWWPADYGHYGPFFIRMAWHSAGTYRVYDGRGGAGGGQQRFEPLNSWPDNANLDKARRLLWPIKQKYGSAISWADLMVLTGNVALESMGFPTYGFAGGREDDWQAELVYWGSETEFLASDRFHGNGELERPLAAVQQGLIYVNPEGPGGNPDPLAAAARIRTTFGAMAMNDEETVALIAGGHTFGKAHGARRPADCVGADPAANGVAGQGVGWDNKCGTGNGADTITSGLEGAWTSNPIAWTQQYIENLYDFEWEQTRSPAGAIQWVPVDNGGAGTVPDAHLEGVAHQPIMFTTDLALKEDPAYREITQGWYENPEGFEDAFARAWFKLTHRDMGPRARYISNDLPDEALLWQDPTPEADYAPITRRDEDRLKERILSTDISAAELVRTAWAAAASYRNTDMRGGTNGGRLRLAPQNGWAINQGSDAVLAELEAIQADFNASNSRKQVSMADLIVLAGAAAIEQAAREAGYSVDVPFRAGRTDATQEMTDTNSFAVLEPTSDGFRNALGSGGKRPAEALIERADLLNLTVAEMTALIGGLRSLGVTTPGTEHGLFTDQPGALSNDFFVNLLDMRTAWAPTEGEAYVFEGRDRVNGAPRWTATEVDLVFGSNAELRAVAEYYAYADAEEVFIDDFVEAWSKVMNLGRFN